MKKLKYLLCLSVMIMMIFVPSTFAAIECNGNHSYVTTSNVTEKASKPTANHCRTRTIRKKCTECNDVKTYTTKLSSHSYDTDNATFRGGCTSPRKTTVKCKQCGFKKTYTISAAKGHDYSKKVKTIKNPSCTMVGTAKYKCSRCNATTEKTFGKALGHACSEFVKTSKKATCVSAGEAIYKCRRTGCNKTITRKTAISKSNHTKYGFEITDTTHQVKCEGCNTLIGSKANHAYDVNGKCACGHSIGIEKCEHQTSVWEVYETTHQKRCSDCGELVVKSAEHTYDDNRKCVCGKTKKVEEVIDTKCDHSAKNISYATCTESQKCNECKKILSGPLGHDYVWEDGTTDWKIAEEYHYRYCERCAAPETLIKENHNFVNYECRNCGYEKGDAIEEDLREPEELDSGDCTHPNLVYTIVKEAKCTTAGEKVASCPRCTYEETTFIEPTHNFVEDSQYYLQKKAGHVLRCIDCGEENTDLESHAWDRTDSGRCSICKYLCAHDFAYGNTCIICGFRQSNFCADGEHELKYKVDDLVHYYVCDKCGYEEEASTGLHAWEKNDNGTYKITDMFNGYHYRECTVCDYQRKTVHLYNEDGVCSSCDSSNITGIQNALGETLEYTATVDEVEALQRHLKGLGYYTGSIDGDIGPASRRAINELLKAQGSSFVFADNAEWGDITPELYTLLLKCEEDKVDYRLRDIRIRKANGETITQEEMAEVAELRMELLGYYSSTALTNKSKLRYRVIRSYMVINGMNPSEYDFNNLPADLLERIMEDEKSLDQTLVNLMNKETDLLTDEQNELFNQIILLAISTDTDYDYETNRNVGPNNFIEYFNSEDSNKAINDVSFFDCSSFASVVMNLVFGIDCGISDNSSYSTHAFDDDTLDQFDSEPCPETGLDISKLKKGQLILVTLPDKDLHSMNHVMVYLGNGLIAHSNGGANGVTIDELSLDNEYTDDFLKEGIGYDCIQILTPKIAE